MFNPLEGGERAGKKQTSQSLLFNAIKGRRYYRAGMDCKGGPQLMTPIQPIMTPTQTLNIYDCTYNQV